MHYRNDECDKRQVVGGCNTTAGIVIQAVAYSLYGVFKRHRLVRNFVLMATSMYGHKREYRTGLAVCIWLEIIGWISLGIGVLVAVYGLGTEGLPDSLNIGNSTDNQHFIIVVTSMIPGILISLSGLFEIIVAQQTKATLGTSEMIHELLEISKRIVKENGH